MTISDGLSHFRFDDRDLFMRLGRPTIPDNIFNQFDEGRLRRNVNEMQ